MDPSESQGILGMQEPFNSECPRDMRAGKRPGVCGHQG